MRRAAILLATAALGVAGCGDDDEIAAETVPGETAATTPTAPAEPTATTTTPTTTAPAQTTPGETVPGSTTGGAEAPVEPDEGGDEEAVRVPADFEVSVGRATPATVGVPAFLTIELRLRSADGDAHEVTLAGTPQPVTVAVGASGTTTRRIEGLKPGDYQLVVDGTPGGAVLRVGTEPGP